MSMGFIFTGDEGSNHIKLEDETQSIAIFAWACLAFNPISMATGQALNRAMRKINENAVAIYSNFS